MNILRILKRARAPNLLRLALLASVLALWLAGFPLARRWLAARSAFIPPPAVQTESFSVALGGPQTQRGVLPADLLSTGVIPLVACEDLGLLCAGSGAVDEIAALSYGNDFQGSELPAVQFSVSGASQGLPGSAVNAEANCSPAEAAADAFESALDGSNLQDLDGDGNACAANSGYGLGLDEALNGDDLDALASDPCPAVDHDCNGFLEEPVYLSLAGGSPSLALLGASPADILATGDGYTALVWASQAQLGLAAGDTIDAICLLEDGDLAYGPGDRLLISLAAGSPTLALINAGPADVLRASPPRPALRASQLGLLQADDLDALLCSDGLVFNDIYLPVLHKR
jgi:hypothetical protein